MFRLLPGRRYEALHLLPAIDPTALALADGADHATAQVLSTPRCQRKRTPLGASGLVMDAVVLNRCPLWLPVPQCNRTRRAWLEHDLANRVSDQLSDASPGPSGRLPQGLELFLAKINLGFFHVCQFYPRTDIRQRAGTTKMMFRKTENQPAFFCRAGARAGFFASRGPRCGSRASFCGCLPAMGSSISRCPSIRLRGFFGCAGPSPEDCTLRRNASIRLITLRGSAAASFLAMGM